MRIAIAWLATMISLSGCMHYARLTPDDFAYGSVSRGKFAHDNYDCRTAAVVRENIERGNGDRVGIYNRAYHACMMKRGYASNNIELAGFGG